VFNFQVSVTVSVAEDIAVICPLESNVISCIYVLPTLSTDDAADITG